VEHRDVCEGFRRRLHGHARRGVERGIRAKSRHCCSPGSESAQQATVTRRKVEEIEVAPLTSLLFWRWKRARAPAENPLALPFGSAEANACIVDPDALC